MKNVILVILGLLILAGGAYYWYTTRDTSDVSDMMIENTESGSDSTEQTRIAIDEIEQTTDPEATTLESLMNSGRTVSCSFERAEGDTKIVGTYNVAGTKMAGDYTVTSEDGMTSNIKMLSDGQFMYTWGDAFQGMGMKVDLAKAKELSAQAQTDATASGSQPQFDSFGAQMQFTCMPWTADPSTFVVPTDVQFITL